MLVSQSSALSACSILCALCLLHPGSFGALCSCDKHCVHRHTENVTWHVRSIKLDILPDTLLSEFGIGGGASQAGQEKATSPSQVRDCFCPLCEGSSLHPRGGRRFSPMASKDKPRNSSTVLHIRQRPSQEYSDRFYCTAHCTHKLLRRNPCDLLQMTSKPVPALSPQTIKTPYWGVQGPYTKTKDPWSSTPMRQFLHSFYARVFLWLSEVCVVFESLLLCNHVLSVALHKAVLSYLSVSHP